MSQSGAKQTVGLGAADAVAHWIAAYRSELLTHLTGMLGNGDDAEDVLQQVWVKAYERPPNDGEGANVRAWLYRVGTNAALDRMATTRRRQGILGSRVFRPPPDAPGPAVLEQMSERSREAVRRHCAKLPPKQRAAVWFRWVEECDYETIARRLNTSVDSARANVYQGLKRLRKELRAVWEQEQAP